MAQSEAIRKELAITYRLWRDVRNTNDKARRHYSRSIIKLRRMLMFEELAKKTYEAIKDTGFYEPRSYSGRYMNGEECIGVRLSDTGSLWDLARTLDPDIAVPEPRIDQLGRGIIAYWPSLKWQDEFNEEGE